jgi:hypothetical protein
MALVAARHLAGVERQLVDQFGGLSRRMSRETARQLLIIRWRIGDRQMADNTPFNLAVRAARESGRMRNAETHGYKAVSINKAAAPRTKPTFRS